MGEIRLGLRRGFVQLGRHRFVWHTFDMEPWRDQVCPGCGQGFKTDPRFTYEGQSVHGLGCIQESEDAAALEARVPAPSSMTGEK